MRSGLHYFYLLHFLTWSFWSLLKPDFWYCPAKEISASVIWSRKCSQLGLTWSRIFNWNSFHVSKNVGPYQSGSRSSIVYRILAYNFSSWGTYGTTMLRFFPLHLDWLLCLFVCRGPCRVHTYHGALTVILRTLFWTTRIFLLWRVTLGNCPLEHDYCHHRCKYGSLIR